MVNTPRGVLEKSDASFCYFCAVLLLLTLLGSPVSGQRHLVPPIQTCAFVEEGSRGVQWPSKLKFTAVIPGTFRPERGLENAQLSVGPMAACTSGLVEYRVKTGASSFVAGTVVFEGNSPSVLPLVLRSGKEIVRIEVPVVPREAASSGLRYRGALTMDFSREVFYDGEDPSVSADTLRTYHHRQEGHYLIWKARFDGARSVRPGKLSVSSSTGLLRRAEIRFSPSSKGGAALVFALVEALPNNSFPLTTVALELRSKDGPLAQLLTHFSPYVSDKVEERNEVRELCRSVFAGISPFGAGDPGAGIKTYRNQYGGFLWACLNSPGRFDPRTTAVAVDCPDGKLNLAFGSAEGFVDGNAISVVARFTDSGRSSFEVKLVPTVGNSPPVVLDKLEVDLPSSQGGDPAAMNAWTYQTIRRLERSSSGRSTPFVSYAARVLRERLEKSGLKSVLEPLPTVRTTERPDLFSAFTGVLAVQESLQLDAMNPESTGSAANRFPQPFRRRWGNAASSDPSPSTAGGVPVDDLRPPAIKSHPFETMLAARSSTGQDMDRLVPEDRLYAHFSSVDSCFGLLDQAENWGQNIVHLTEGSSRALGARQRYLDRLALDSSGLSRLFGKEAITDLGVVASDPFVREGTDLAFIVGIKSNGLLDAGLLPPRARAVLEGAKTSNESYRGVEIRSWISPDGRVSLHEADLGRYRVLSTGRKLLHAIVDASSGKSRSIASAVDYRYMRSLLPAKADEDGFVYLSDSFVRRMVGPRLKIANYRRLVCSGNLTLIQSAGLLSRMEHRKQPTLGELETGGYIRKGLTCPDGGAYSIDGDEAACSCHGRLRCLKPLDETAVSLVKHEEAAVYREFVEQYSRYWNTYFDPVGVLIKNKDRLTAETVILPLVENSIYTGLKYALAAKPEGLEPVLARRTAPRHGQVWVGPEEDSDGKTNPGKPPAEQLLSPQSLAPWGALPDSPMALSLTVPAWAIEHLEERYEMASWLAAEEHPSRWLGNSVSLVVHDNQPVFTLDFSPGSFLSSSSLFRPNLDSLLGLFCISSLDMPVVASVAVSDEVKARSFLEKAVLRLVKLSREKGRDILFIGRVETDSYTVLEGSPCPISVVTVNVLALRLRFCFAVHRGRLWVSNQLPNLIASLKAPAPGRTTAAHLALSLTPTKAQRLETSRQLALSERARSICAVNQTPAWVLLGLARVNPREFAGSARRLLGYEPVCPEGGQYRYDPSTDELCCSLHGTLDRPRQPTRPQAGSTADQTLSDLGEFSVGLSFTTEGLVTRLEVETSRRSPKTR